MLIELGGGAFPRGDGYLSIDLNPVADIIHDLDVVPYPLESDSVDGVYSSHCLEHLESPQTVLDEVCRVCKLGAPVEIRVPHPHSHLAMTAGHRHVFSPVHAINIDHYHPQYHWHGPRRLKLLSMDLEPTFMLGEARDELPFLSGLSDDVIMKWIPGTCHEVRYYYEVITNEHHKA